jgi:hypothetical protein
VLVGAVDLDARALRGEPRASSRTADPSLFFELRVVIERDLGAGGARRRQLHTHSVARRSGAECGTGPQVGVLGVRTNVTMRADPEDCGS